MDVKVDVSTIDPVRRRLAIEVPQAEVGAQIEKAYAELSRGARVAGFRPGRAPRAVLERMFGDRVRADVFGRLIQESYAAALEDKQLEPVGQPEIVTEQAEPGRALRYSATVEVKPEVVVERYTGLEVERRIVPVTEADVDAQLERLRDGFAQLHPIGDRTHIALGDVVTLDYEARADGRLVGRGEGRNVEVGANGFPPEFDTALQGAPVSEALEFDATYPVEGAPAELSGKTVRFRVTPRAIARKELPALDDEFAKDHGECETLEELRQRVRQRLEEEAGRYADESVRRALLGALVQANDVPVPEAMVRRRTLALVEEVWHEWQQRRVLPQNESEALARLQTELEPQAREQVKLALVLEAIARQEGLTVREEEIDAHVAEVAASAGAAADRVHALYQQAEARAQLRQRLLQSRAIDAVVAGASVTNVEISSVAAQNENR
jgi:trigger factor